MKVIIDHLDGNYVYCSTELGNLRGIWFGSLPLLHKKYTVELGVQDVVSLSDIYQSGATEHKILCTGTEVCITGFAEEYEDDILFLRVGVDLVMIGTNPYEDFSSFCRKCACITVQHVMLYDLGY